MMGDDDRKWWRALEKGGQGKRGYFTYLRGTQGLQQEVVSSISN